MSAFSYYGEMLDTNVELYIKPFAITYGDKDKLLNELEAVIAKYMI
jgi:hypothetical protein